MRKLILIVIALSFFATASTCRKRSPEYVTVALPEKFTAFDTLTSTASDASAERIKNLIFNSLVKRTRILNMSANWQKRSRLRRTAKRSHLRYRITSNFITVRHLHRRM
ncbi:MAG: hypothetical protein IPK98_13540 [Chloracidobacterium sp.]|nr:hypothetical protein [Chloracidobacterium sp.]